MLETFLLLYRNEGATTYRRLALTGVSIIAVGAVAFVYEQIAASQGIREKAVVFDIRKQTRGGYETNVYGINLPHPLSGQVWTLIDHPEEIEVGSALPIRISKFYFIKGYRVDRWSSLFVFTFLFSILGVMTATCGPLILWSVRSWKSTGRGPNKRNI